MSPFVVLLIEDDLTVAQEVILEFRKLGIAVDHTPDGTDGLRRSISQHFDLVISDIELPGTNGLDICRELRAAKPLLPVILLTSRTQHVDRVLGFELGADDYVTKPYEIAELLARVRSKLRRASAMRELGGSALASETRPGTVTIGDVKLDTGRRTVEKRGQVVALTAKEFDLLAFFMLNAGSVVSKQEILQLVWNVQTAGYEDAIVAVVSRLRKKIEDSPDEPKYLFTCRGVGYSFADPADFKK